MAMLVRTRGTHSGHWLFPLGQRCLLGRDPTCDLSDIFKDVRGISRHHAQIERAGDQYVIEDRGSRNGTLVNGRRLTGRHTLHNGDRIGLCNIELVFYEDSLPGEPLGSDSNLTVEEVDAQSLASVPVAPPEPAAPPGQHSEKKLRALASMLKSLGRSLDTASTLQELLAGLFAIFPQADRGFVAFRESPHTVVSEAQDTIVPRATLFRDPKPGRRVAMSRTLISHVLARREAVLWLQHRKMDSLPNSTTLEALDVRSVMCAPLLDAEGKSFGVVQVDSTDPRQPFSTDDVEIMAGAVSQAAVAVRYARLHEESLKRQALERDLQLARQVQHSLLPAEPPLCPPYQFFAYYQTAHEVGGDYYDFVELPGGRLAIVLADVAGKGVSAALLMAKLCGELKYYLSCADPAAAVARMNDSLCQGGAGRFVTLLLAILERSSPRLTLVNAGHLAPLRRRSTGAIEILGENLRGPALGIVPDTTWTPVEAAVGAGDVWLALTDGVTEAVNAAGEMYGAARLRRKLAQAPAEVGSAGEAILADLRQFLADQAQSDDICLVGWGYPAGPATGGADKPAASETGKFSVNLPG
jgi:serine phosphatase RsbU (regulator of sigma subunit)